MIDYRPRHERDEQLYPVCLNAADGIPVIEWRKRREFPKHIIKTKYNLLLNNRWFGSWNCFISGIQCYPTSNHVEGKIDSYNLNWALSVDHLCCLKFHRGDERFLRLNNQKLVGRQLNRTLGHIPLALKLHLRNRLKTQVYDRSRPDPDLFDEIIGQIVKYQMELSYAGRYPWQPWAYDNHHERKVAQSFLNKLMPLHKEFIEVPMIERDSWLDNFEWNY